MAIKTKSKRRRNIRYKIRKKIEGSVDLPRLSVFRSNKSIYAQLIDDIAGNTLVAADSKKASGTKKDAAKEAGKKIAEKAKAAGIENVVFDRSGYLYHGRIKAFAEGAREGGLKF